jgi:CxxC motif-containing protein
MKKEMICIMCPMGCRMTVYEKDGEIKVEGNTCPRGKKYAQQEYISPERVVTALVRIKGGKVAPVKTDIPIPKGAVFRVLREIGKREVVLPVHIGDVVIEDVCGTGAKIVITKDIDV